MSDTTSIRKFDRKAAKAQASARIKEEMTPPIQQLTLLVAVISMVATELLSVLSESGVNGFLVLLISIVLDIVLMLFLSGDTVYIMKVARVQPGAGYPDLKYGFGPMAGKLILLMIETAVRVYLWTLLFVIPGLVAAYRYHFSLYILIDNPDIPAGEAIHRSKAMTQGRKGEQLALDLSFTGWYILAVLLQTVGTFIGATLGTLTGSIIAFYLLSIVVSVLLMALIMVCLQAYMGVTCVYFYDFARNEALRTASEAAAAAQAAGGGGSFQHNAQY